MLVVQASRAQTWCASSGRRGEGRYTSARRSRCCWRPKWMSATRAARAAAAAAAGGLTSLGADAICGGMLGWFALSSKGSAALLTSKQPRCRVLHCSTSELVLWCPLWVMVTLC